MRKLEVTVILVLFSVLGAAHENSSPQNHSDDRLVKIPDKIIHKKAVVHPQPNPVEEERTFMSQIAGWIFPFANWDGKSAKSIEPITSATHNQYHSYPPYSPSHLPPPHQKEQCNPCNKEPWIPMASNYGQNTIINFVNPSELNGGGLVPQASAYPGHPSHSPPKLPLAVSYGPPKPPLQNYGTPASFTGHFKSPSISPPPQILSPTAGKAGPPIPLNYFSPPSMALGVPIKNFGPPPNLVPPRPLSTEIYPSIQYGPPLPVALPSESEQIPVDMKPPAPPSNRHPPRNHPYPQLALTFMPPPPPPRPQHSYNSMNIPPMPMNTNFLGSGWSSSGPGLEAVPSRVVPLPQLHPAPLPPLRNQQNFHAQNEPAASNTGHVELIPSVRVADYLSSVQHPINVVQSPLVDIVATGPPQIKPNINENPIVVSDDTHAAAATINNKTYEEHTTSTSFIKPHLNIQPTIAPKPFTSNINTPSYTNYPLSTYSTLPSQPPITSALTGTNIGIDFINQFLTNPNTNKEAKGVFTQPPTDYTNWTPKFETVAEGITVPDLKESVWLTATGKGEQIEVNKRPKQIQIVIPYKTTIRPNINYKRPVTSSFDYSTATHRPTISIVTEPSIKQPIWINYTNSKPEGSEYVTTIAATPKPFSSVMNIKDLLKQEVSKERERERPSRLPFDVLRLQKNIDDWTQQEFSQWMLKGSTSGKLVPSKNIPSEYFTTVPYSNYTDSTEKNTIDDFDHEVAGSFYKESKIGKENEVDEIFTHFTNTPTTQEFTTEQSTTEQFTTFISTTFKEEEEETKKPKWDYVSISPGTKEKVYVVTPQPWNVVPEEINEKLISTKPPETKITPSHFSVVVQPEKDNVTDDSLNDVKSDLKVIFSEWPHIINNLVTTTTTTTERVKTTRHPLLGLMDLSSYTPPANATVQTYSGHSRVITVVTPSSILKKRNTSPLQKNTNATTSRSTST